MKQGMFWKFGRRFFSYFQLWIVVLVMPFHLYSVVGLNWQFWLYLALVWWGLLSWFKYIGPKRRVKSFVKENKDFVGEDDWLK